MLSEVGAEAAEVRTPGDLAGLDALIIPGGESTTIVMGMNAVGLDDAIRDRHAAGMPILGTCAGMIVCDDAHLGLIDATARRNAFGRQLQSFEADLQVDGLGPDPIRAVFIRAPWIERHGPDVEVLASYDGYPVVVREGSLLATAFHPELTDDARIHAVLMAMVSEPASRAGERAR
jgi:5'-phosphate synthase pdxT subunit